ncbi:hypothetical protein RRF57_006232 [Xylaria bambusicola]|uniref:Uncharacterized protein n=1 Tax=Xylaria bambusicola TaxID=326684 RepID=A0AAN7Z6N2_9PEZI
MASISETVKSFVHRSEFWLTAPDRRYRFWETDSPGRAYFFSAADLVQFTETNCLAKANPNSSDISKFKNEFQASWEANKTNPDKGMALAQSVANYLVWIDRLFFFGIITQQDKRKDESDHRSLIQLAFEDKLVDPEGEIEGVFMCYTATLWVNIKESSGEYQSFEKLFCIIVHELCHVYLGILTKDNNASRYYKDVELDKGHGVQFQELLQFIFTQLFEWMPKVLLFGELAAEHQRALQTALAQPAVSETIARSRIYATSDANIALAHVSDTRSRMSGIFI